jgi:SulP family sulfate permease
MNDSAGGKTQVTGLVTSAVLALTLLFLTGALRSLPMAVLAAVLVMAAVGLFDLRGLATLLRVSPPEFLVCIITLLGVITVGVLQGVVVAIAVAGVLMVARNSRPNTAVLGRIPGTNAFLDIATHPKVETFPGLFIFRFDATLVFFNADYFRECARTAVRGAPGPIRYFLLDAETIPYLDTTGAASLGELCDNLEDEGIAIAIAAAKAPVRDMLDKTGLAARIGPDRMFHTVELAVEALLKAPALVEQGKERS